MSVAVATKRPVIPRRALTSYDVLEDIRRQLASMSTAREALMQRITRCRADAAEHHKVVSAPIAARAALDALLDAQANGDAVSRKAVAAAYAEVEKATVEANKAIPAEQACLRATEKLEQHLAEIESRTQHLRTHARTVQLKLLDEITVESREALRCDAQAFAQKVAAHLAVVGAAHRVAGTVGVREGDLFLSSPGFGAVDLPTSRAFKWGGGPDGRSLQEDVFRIEIGDQIRAHTEDALPAMLRKVSL